MHRRSSTYALLAMRVRPLFCKQLVHRHRRACRAARAVVQRWRTAM